MPNYRYRLQILRSANLQAHNDNQVLSDTHALKLPCGDINHLDDLMLEMFERADVPMVSRSTKSPSNDNDPHMIADQKPKRTRFASHCRLSQRSKRPTKNFADPLRNKRKGAR